MKKIIFLIFLTGYFLAAFEYPDKYSAKIDKTIIKDFKIEIFKKSHVDLPDSIDFELYSIDFEDSILGYFSVSKVNSCRIGGCNRPADTSEVSFEYFWYLAVFDIDLKIITIRVLDYQAERGQEIASRGWLKQFKGKSAGKISYSNDIDAISGATISGNAITNHINYIGNILVSLRNNNNI